MAMGCERGAAETKTSYQLDCAFEWDLIQQGIQKVATVAKVRALELDGLVVSPLYGNAGVAFERKVQAKLDEIEPGLFKLKPYRSLAELEVIIRAEWPANSWDVVDSDWENICHQRLHVHRRLLSGESPAVLIAPLVPYTLMGNGKILKDMLVSARMGKDNWYWWTWQDREFGGFWAEDLSDTKGWFELRVVDCLCQIMGVHVDWAWPAWVNGTLTSAVISRLGRGFTNPLFVRNLDGTQTYNYIQFECGRVYNTETHTLESGRPELMISRCTGFRFPEQEFARFDAVLSEKGINLEAISN